MQDYRPRNTPAMPSADSRYETGGCGRVRAFSKFMASALFVVSYFAFAGLPAAVSQQILVNAPAPGSFNVAGIGTGTRQMDGLWQFHLGDNPRWSQPDFDDRTWEHLPADKPWGDAGHPGYTGFAWYRRQIALDPADNTPLGLLLPPLNSVAEVYWNGVKVGGIGTLPPHAFWYYNPHSVAILLPSPMDAHSATLAIRLWEHPSGSSDAPDSGGFQSAPVIGYSALIRQMPLQWVEHNLHVQAIRYAALVVFFLSGLIALALWARLRSQWILLCVAIYFCAYAISVGSQRFPSIGFRSGQSIGMFLLCFLDMSAAFLILLLADLPERRGVKGLRFWKRICLLLSAASVLASVTSVWATLSLAGPHLAIYRFTDSLSEVMGDAVVLLKMALLAACFLLSRPSGARLLFMSAATIDIFVQDISATLMQGYTRNDVLSAFMHHPLLRIGGALLSVYVTAKLLLLITIAYAVWERLSEQLARQRMVDAELKAAQEIQQILVPAAVERDAPGYAVTSVYRPASEVGGDFFQIVPLQGNGTLIVAGDVSGKGLPAAMTVSLIVGALRTLAEQDPNPGVVLAGLNRRLTGRVQGGFVTCCVVRVDPSGRGIIANAGHCLPFLDDEELEMPAGLPLGLIEGLSYEEVAIDITHGQQLTMMTDGVVEARNARGELYGFDRLNQLMHDRPTAADVANAAVNFGQEDDITVLTVTRLATAQSENEHENKLATLLAGKIER